MQCSVVNQSCGENRVSVDENLVNKVDFLLAVVTTFSLCFLGILGNIFAIAVWQMETGPFNATVFLFKYMGVWDSVYLGMVIVYNTIHRRMEIENELFKISVFYFGNLVHLVSVTVTLLIAVTRWYAVTHPMETHTQQCCLLRPKGVYLSCLFILLWSLLLEVSLVIFNIYCPGSYVMFAVKKVVGLALPLLVLFIININLLWTVLRSRSDLQRFEDNTAQRPARPPENRQTSSNSGASHETMVKAVLLVSLCSFIAFPVGNGLQIYVFYQTCSLSELTARIFVSVTLILQVINSGINALIYWFFVSRFRYLTAILWRRLHCRCRGPRSQDRVEFDRVARRS